MQDDKSMFTDEETGLTRKELTGLSRDEIRERARKNREIGHVFQVESVKLQVLDAQGNPDGPVFDLPADVMRAPGIIEYEAEPVEGEVILTPVARIHTRDSVENQGGAELYVLEVYPAVQGEGIFMGAPTVFTRLAGCTVGCHYCDTKYSWKARRGERYTPRQLADHAIKLAKPFRRIALTGGEPMEHPWPLVAEFLHWCRMEGMHVTIETSGVFFPDFNFHLGMGLGDNLWSIAPKLDAAKANYPFPDLNEWCNMAQRFSQLLQFKLVCATTDDIDESFDRMEFARRTNESIISYPTFIQPATMYNEKDAPEKVAQGIIDLTKQLQDYILTTGKFAQYRHFYVRPQQHALYYGAKRQV
jgi:organic radical activating enzyme